MLFLSVIKSGASPDALGLCAGRIRMLLVSYKRFPLFSVPFTLCSIIRERAAVILLGGWASPADVGYYSQAWRIMNFPVGLSGSAIRPVLFHAAAEQGLVAQEARIGKILTALIVIGAPWLAVIMYRPEDLFGVVLGQPWRNAGTYASMLSIPIFLFVLSNWMDRILDVVGRQDLNLFTEFLSAVTSIAGLLIALASGASILTAVATQSIILALNYALFIVIAYRVSGYQLFMLVRLLILLVILVAVFLLLLHVVVGQEPDLKAFIWGVVPVSVVSMVSCWLVMRGLR
jgi:O-antigen/teichoic acid export membrane protein